MQWCRVSDRGALGPWREGGGAAGMCVEWGSQCVAMHVCRLSSSLLLLLSCAAAAAAEDTFKWPTLEPTANKRAAGLALLVSECGHVGAMEPAGWPRAMVTTTQL